MADVIHAAPTNVRPVMYGFFMKNEQPATCPGLFLGDHCGEPAMLEFGAMTQRSSDRCQDEQKRDRDEARAETWADEWERERREIEAANERVWRLR